MVPSQNVRLLPIAIFPWRPVWAGLELCLPTAPPCPVSCVPERYHRLRLSEDRRRGGGILANAFQRSRWVQPPFLELRFSCFQKPSLAQASVLQGESSDWSVSDLVMLQGLSGPY